jgi:hypothetical protein
MEKTINLSVAETIIRCCKARINPRISGVALALDTHYYRMKLPANI